MEIEGLSAGFTLRYPREGHAGYIREAFTTRKEVVARLDELLKEGEKD